MFQSRSIILKNNIIIIVIKKCNNNNNKDKIKVIKPIKKDKIIFL